MARTGSPPMIAPLTLIYKAVMDNDVSTFSVELAAATTSTPRGQKACPPHIAADRGTVEFTKALPDAGVEIDPINVWGNTPLWVAIIRQSRKCPDSSMTHLLRDHSTSPSRTECKNSPL